MFGCFKQWIKVCFAIVTCVLGSICNAQDQGFFQQVWQEEGLSQSSVYNIVQDNKGFIWLATQDGLNRYDGRHLDKINMQPFNPQSLSGDIIENIGKAGGNSLWVQTAEGLDLFNMETLRAKRIKPFLEGKTNTGISIYMLWEVKERVFLFTSEGFKELLETWNGQYEMRSFQIEYNSSPDKLLNVFALQEDGSGNLFIGTTAGVFKCTAGSFTFRSFSPLTEDNRQRDVFHQVCSELRYKQNTLYFSSANKLYSYTLGSNEIHSFSTGALPQGNISCLLIDNQNKLWIGTRGDGLYRLSQNEDGSLLKDKHFIDNGRDKYGLKCNFIECLFQGNDPDEDAVWIGSGEAGAFIYNYSKNSVKIISSILDNPKLSFFGLAKDRQNTLWCGIRGGVYRIDLHTGHYRYIDLSALLQNAWRPVQAIYCDSSDNVYIGIDNTICRIDKRRNTLVKVAGPLFPGEKINTVFKITGTVNGLLAATDRGLALYDRVTDKTTTISQVKVDDKLLSIQHTGALLIDSRKNWWFRTKAGVVMLNKKDNKNRCYSHQASDQNSLLTNSVLDMKECRNGDILIATSKGLSIIKDPYGKGQIENHYAHPGLSNNFIYGMLQDAAGKFWMSTNYGITVFDPEKSTFKSFHASDGIYINEFNSDCYLAAPDGELFFGGVNGLICFYPQKLIRSFSPPNPVLRTLKINQQNTDSLLSGINSSLELNYTQNSLYLEFSFPDFSGIGRNKLLYHFSGTNDSWKEMGESNAFWLANIAPGDYFLKVKVVNDEGLESANPFGLSIHIHAPFWKTGWFLIVLMGICSAFIMMIYRFRLMNKIALVKEMDRVRQEENEKVRKAAALDLHDEFGNGLTRISVLVETLKIKLPKENSDAMRLLSLIAENSSRLYQGTKDFIWSIHPGNDNLYEVIIRIKDFGDELFYSTGINFEVSGLRDEFKNFFQPPGTGRNITMIYKEAMTNILKHAGADKISLIVSENEKEVKIILKDNGKGFDTAFAKNGFGISNMQHRAAKAGALLIIHSEPANGSEIILILKL